MSDVRPTVGGCRAGLVDQLIAMTSGGCDDDVPKADTFHFGVVNEVAAGRRHFH